MSKLLNVYLAGKMDKDERLDFTRALLSRGDMTERLLQEDVYILDISDPRDKPVEDKSYGDFVAWDINAVRNSDLIVVLDDTGLSMKGTMAEMGIAYALNKRIIVYTKAKFIHPFIAYMASLVVTDLDVLVNYLLAYARTGDIYAAYYEIYDR